MANRPKGYGMTRDIADKMSAKYDNDEEAEINSWICARTGIPAPSPGRDAFAEWLGDGVVLYKLIESFDKAEYKYKLKESTSTFEAMRKNIRYENIGKFLNKAEEMGVARLDLFQTVDLAEKANLSQVQRCLYSLSSAARKRNVDGPLIGVKTSDKNLRDFDEDTQRAGRNVIGLQMGTNQVASQKGMTGYGQGRQIVHKTN